MAFTNPTYFVNTTNGARRGVQYYAGQDETETWDDKGNPQKPPGLQQGNQLNGQCTSLEQAGYQKDPNPGWTVPDKPKPV
jgi:hypothetical protein